MRRTPFRKVSLCGDSALGYRQAQSLLRVAYDALNRLDSGRCDLLTKAEREQLRAACGKLDHEICMTEID